MILILLLYFRRPYKGTSPFLVTSSYLVRKLILMIAIMTKIVFRILLTFVMTHIFLYEI